jgi:hypothetical protein
MNNLSEILKKTRKRLLEFRQENSEDEVSIHMNAFEIAVCLTEFSLSTKPTRPISKEEQQWFNAGYHIGLILNNSKWEDLVKLYFAIVEDVEKRNFFR